MDIATTVKSLITLLGKPVSNQVSRSEKFLELCEKLGIQLQNPPQDFQFIYRCTLVYYAVNSQNSTVFLKILRQESIIEAFHLSFQNQCLEFLVSAVESLSEWSYLGDQIREFEIDARKELEIFSSYFRQMVLKYQNPSETLIAQAIDRQEFVLQEWNNFIDEYRYSNSDLVRFETNSKKSSVMKLADLDDENIIEIKIKEYFHLIYELPYQAHLMLLQGCNSKWMITRFSQYTNNDLRVADKRVKERLIWGGPGELIWPPRSHQGLVEKSTIDLGKHQFVLFCSQNIFPDHVINLVKREAGVLSSSSLADILSFAKSNTHSIQYIIAECDIILS